MSKKNKYPARKKIALELLHQRLGQRSTRSLLAGDIANVWEDIELRIDPYPFGTSCKIYSMNKKARSKIPLKPEAPFKWGFMDIIPSTAPQSLTSDTTFSNYLVIVDAYYNIPKLMVWIISQQKKLWTNWICFSPDSGKWTNLDCGIYKESQQLQVRSLS